MTFDGLVPPAIVFAATTVLLVTRVSQRSGRKRYGPFDLAAVLLLALLAGGLERAMGRPWTYRRGPVQIWSGNISSDQNSQQVADPYTLTHVSHGALFYGLTRVALPSAALPIRLLTTVGIEAAWEAYENTDTVIERYRAATVSIGYYGDSVINSLSDILACVIGFWLTSRLSWRATLSWVVAVEIILALWIRDNLSLNLLMLIHPIDAIRVWQAGV